MAVQSSQRNRFRSPAWQVVLTILGAAIFLYGTFFILLGIIGTPVSATVTNVKMQGAFQSNSVMGPKGTVVVDYTFTIPDGRSFSGSSTYQTDTDYNDPANLEQFKTVSVHYFPFFPQVSQVSVLSGLRLDSLAIPLLGLILIVLVNWSAIRYRKKMAALQTASAPKSTPFPTSQAVEENMELHNQAEEKEAELSAASDTSFTADTTDSNKSNSSDN